MNLAYGNIINVFEENGLKMGKIQIKGVLKNTPLTILPEAQPGDEVLLCDGIPIGKVKN